MLLATRVYLVPRGTENMRHSSLSLVEIHFVMIHGIPFITFCFLYTRALEATLSLRLRQSRLWGLTQQTNVA